jgi:hypothetical protein
MPPVANDSLLHVLRRRAATGTAGTPRRRAVRHRDRLVVALLAARPLRRRNPTGLRLGHSLVRRRGGGWWIVLPGEETKNHDPLEVPWPGALAPAREAWLAVHWKAPRRGAVGRLRIQRVCLLQQRPLCSWNPAAVFALGAAA